MKNTILIIICLAFIFSTIHTGCNDNGNIAGNEYYCSYIDDGYNVCSHTVIEIDSTLSNIFVIFCEINSDGNASVNSCIPPKPYCLAWDTGEPGLSYFFGNGIDQNACEDMAGGFWDETEWLDK
ncbi:hypothetical protein ACFL20_02305 [Spirochaetota bacterium]